MGPGVKKTAILLGIVAGLIITHGCGSSNSNNTVGGGGTGNTAGVTISNEVSSPSEMNIGDIMMVQFSSLGSAEIDFSGADSSSQYYLAVGNLDSSYGSHSVTIQGSLNELETKSMGEASYSVDDSEDEKWASWTAADAFQQRLFDIGHAMAIDPNVTIADPAFSVSAKAAVSPKAAGVGDTEDFRVLNSLSSVSSYTTVTGRVKCVLSNVIIYLDTEVESENPDDLTDSEIATLCDAFNNQVTTEREVFGNESDVNGDGKVAALLTPQVNRLGSMGGGIITGFFLASDLYSRDGSNLISNEREIVYTLVPDSEGVYGMVIPTTFAKDNLLSAVLPHEFQHVISYNQHVFEGEGSPEYNWLNEGLSHFAEDLVGYGQENYSRVGIFLNSPSSYKLAATGSPDLGERGAAYLFVRFLYEQHGDPETFLWDLYHNNTSGIANVENAFAGTSESFDQFGEFFMRWMSALVMTNRGISADTRYVYEPRTWNSETERWLGICLICNAEDGRGSVLNGPTLGTYNGSSSFYMYSSSTRFYNVDSVPDVVTFNSTSSGTYGAVLVRKQ